MTYTDYDNPLGEKTTLVRNRQLAVSHPQLFIRMASSEELSELIRRGVLLLMIRSTQVLTTTRHYTHGHLLPVGGPPHYQTRSHIVLLGPLGLLAAFLIAIGAVPCVFD